MITRRNFCVALGGLVTAPYVIRNSGVLMPVRDRTVVRRLVWAMNPLPGVSQPVGIIMPFYPTPPVEWLPFDGRTISQVDYPELFNACGWRNNAAVELITFDPKGINVPTYEAIPKEKAFQPIRRIARNKVTFGDTVKLLDQTGRGIG